MKNSILQKPLNKKTFTLYSIRNIRDLLTKERIEILGFIQPGSNYEPSTKQRSNTSVRRVKPLSKTETFYLTLCHSEDQSGPMPALSQTLGSRVPWIERDRIDSVKNRV